MNYFVTGATGFIGKFLVERLLQRQGTVYVLRSVRGFLRALPPRQQFRGAG